MNYPFWDIGISYGWLMALIAVTHVFVSHFAIGGGLYLVVTEHLARKRQDEIRLAFLRKLSKVFILVTLVFGALSGVGIWFVIGLLNPAATEALIHNFVWGWAIEWTFFVVEIAAALIYFYGWDRLNPKQHLTIGWIYFIAAWLSLVIINGILTFMLTPGAWITTGYFWDGFFNPTYWSTLVFRTGVCIMLAGLYALLVGTPGEHSPARSSLMRYNAKWALVGLLLMLPSFGWYWKTIPAEITTKALAAMPTPIQAMSNVYWLAAAVALLVLVFGMALPRYYRKPVGWLTMLLALAWFGEFEWFRESIRKPYVISGYIYGNGIDLLKAENYQQDGLLAHMAYRTTDPGADLFRRACKSCHTYNGYKAVLPAFDGADTAFIAAIVKGTHLLRGNMPPWIGTDNEASLIAAHLYSKTSGKSLAEITGLSGVSLGQKVYEQRCGKCHVIGGFNDKTNSLVGLTREDYDGMLDMAQDLGEGMPAFTGTKAEREALIEYLLTLKKGGGDVASGL